MPSTADAAQAPSPFLDATDPPGPRVAAGLARIGLALRAAAWAGAAPRGLTPTQGQVLALLRAATGGLTVSDVADRLAVACATASEAIATLVRKGLVRKVAAPSDGRARVLTLTAAGRREADGAAAWPDVLLGAIEVLESAEQAVLLRALVKMIRTLQEQGRIPVARMCVTCRFFRPHVHADPDRPHYCAFVDAPFGDRHLRLDCSDHEAAPRGEAEARWAVFLTAHAGHKSTGQGTRAAETHGAEERGADRAFSG